MIMDSIELSENEKMQAKNEYDKLAHLFKTSFKDVKLVSNTYNNILK